MFKKVIERFFGIETLKKAANENCYFFHCTCISGQISPLPA
jgi:hypothetical protein